MKFDTDGRVKQMWAFPQGTSAAGEIAWVHGMAVAANGDLYLGDIQGRRVQKFVRRAATAAHAADVEFAPSHAQAEG